MNVHFTAHTLTFLSMWNMMIQFVSMGFKDKWVSDLEGSFLYS